MVCPMGVDDAPIERLDGILIRQYPPPPETRSFATYLYEFAYCWLRTARLVLRAHRAEGFDLIQACNPPDTYWALALPFKLAGGGSSSISTTSARRCTSRGSRTVRALCFAGSDCSSGRHTPSPTT